MMHESSMGGYNSRSPHALRKRAATLEDLHAISDSDRANDWVHTLSFFIIFFLIFHLFVTPELALRLSAYFFCFCPFHS